MEKKSTRMYQDTERLSGSEMKISADSRTHIEDILSVQVKKFLPYSSDLNVFQRGVEFFSFYQSTSTSSPKALELKSTIGMSQTTIRKKGRF